MIEYIAGGLVGLVLWLIINGMINAKVNAMTVTEEDREDHPEIVESYERNIMVVWWVSLVALVVLFGVIGGLFIS